jgi:hypothetical protein
LALLTLGVWYIGHADVTVSAVIAGLHRLDLGQPRLTPALEYKRRLISSLYTTDKTAASLNGTPLLLSKRFCYIQLPLDLNDDELFLSKEAFAEAVGRLGPDGVRILGYLYLEVNKKC